MEKKKIIAKTNSKRLLWADVIRIIAIYLVVQFHTFTPPSHEIVSFFISKIAIVSVPLFMMLSGALLLGGEDDYKTFFKKRCLKVLLPWIVWTVIYMFYFLYFYEPNKTKEMFFSDTVSPILQWMKFFLQMFLSNLWFLPLIFSIYIIMPLLRILIKYAKENDIWYLIGLWFLTISILPFFYLGPLFPRWEPSFLYTAIQYVGYLFLGYVIVKKRIFQNSNAVVLLFAGLLTLALRFFFSGQSAFQLFTEGFLYPDTVIASCFIFGYLFEITMRNEKYMKTSMNKVIILVSKATLGVYIIHKFVYDLLINILGQTFQQHILGILFTLIIFVVSTVVVLILQKIPIIKYIVP